MKGIGKRKQNSMEVPEIALGESGLHQEPKNNKPEVASASGTLQELSTREHHAQCVDTSLARSHHSQRLGRSPVRDHHGQHKGTYEHVTIMVNARKPRQCETTMVIVQKPHLNKLTRPP
jgi:hypothetical protein